MNALLSQLVFWHWFALAIILGILDVMLGVNFLFIWCGFSAAIVGILVLLLPGIGWEYQLLIFSIGVMASLIVWQVTVRKNLKLSDSPNLNRRAQQYVGRIFTLETPIVNGRGKVKVDDSMWRVEGEDLPVGAKVKVVDVNGVVLKVEKI